MNYRTRIYAKHFLAELLLGSLAGLLLALGGVGGKFAVIGATIGAASAFLVGLTSRGLCDDFGRIIGILIMCSAPVGFLGFFLLGLLIGDIFTSQFVAGLVFLGVGAWVSVLYVALGEDPTWSELDVLVGSSILALSGPFAGAVYGRLTMGEEAALALRTLQGAGVGLLIGTGLFILRNPCSRLKSAGCTLWLHSWNGCKCESCGKIRDRNHDWSEGYQKGCTICGKPFRRFAFLCALGFHRWFIYCLCLRCGKNRDTNHDWSRNCNICAECGKTRDFGHRWQIMSSHTTEDDRVLTEWCCDRCHCITFTSTEPGDDPVRPSH